MPHDETMTRADWLKQANIAGRMAASRNEPHCSREIMLTEIVAWRARHPTSNAIIGVGAAFRRGWLAVSGDNTPR